MALIETKGQTIEQRGRDRALVKQQKILSGENTVYLFIHSQDYYALELPLLTSGDPELATNQPFQDELRYHPIDGDIYTSTSRDIQTEPTEIIEIDKKTGKVEVFNRRKIKYPKKFNDKRSGKRRENNHENYVSMARELPNGKMSDVAHPDDIPLEGDVKRLIIHRVWGGLETAIRQQYDILESYDPNNPFSEPQILRNMLYWLDNTTTKLRENEIDKSDLNRIAIEAATISSNARLPNAIDKKKQKLANMLSKAADIDSLGRVNTTISRTRLSSARTTALERILISELITSKFSANLGVLLAERFVTRDAMTKASEELKEIQEQLRNGDVSYTARSVMARRVDQLGKENLRIPRVAPYLIPSRAASIFLNGGQKNQRENDTKILGQEFADDMFQSERYDELRPVNYLIFSGHTRDAIMQIHRVTDILDDALTEFENILPPKEENNQFQES